MSEETSDFDYPGDAELNRGGTEWAVCNTCGDTIVPCWDYGWRHDEFWNTSPDCQMSAEPVTQEGGVR